MKKAEVIQLAKQGFPIQTNRGMGGIAASATINGVRIRKDTAWAVIAELNMRTEDKYSHKVWTLPNPSN